MDEQPITLRDGTACFVRTATPATPRGTVVVIHGALEHGQYYEPLAERFRESGWSVILPDVRGLGRSGGPRMHVQAFEDYFRDLDEVLQRPPLPQRPLVLFGHSMGGLIAIRYAQTRAGQVQGLILSAPLLKVALPIPAWVMGLGFWISRLFPRIKFRSGIRSEHLSRNPDYLDRRRRDPLVRGRVTAGWFRASLAAMQDAHASRDSYRGPVLLLQGTDDAVTDAASACRWAETVGAEVHRLAGQRHALIQEPEREATFEIILRWLEQAGF